MITNTPNNIINQQEPNCEQAMETIISAVRMLQLNYESHVRLDLCIKIVRNTLDEKNLQIKK